jgi:hypothetical protein
MTEDGGNVEASLALDVHKVAIGSLNKALLLVHGLLGGGQRVKEIDNQLSIITRKR